jgi:glyoxylase-like metal-dependent hydrolase (beta-lactamase superfamily II)
MIARQYLHTEPVVAASYLFGCGNKSEGAVVDPILAPEVYARDAEAVGLAIKYVIDTHVHADHLSTGRQLSELVGAPYVLHESAGASFPFASVRHGDLLEAGNTSIKVLHTPGHTPEHVTLAVIDHTRSEEAWFLLTGHTLMIGDMGRTELASSAEEGASALFASAEQLRQLPDYVEIWPGAFSGSVCGRGLSGRVSSTIGFERRFNRAFALTDRDAFVELMLRDIPPKPERAEEIRAENLGHVAATAP